MSLHFLLLEVLLLLPLFRAETDVLNLTNSTLSFTQDIAVSMLDSDNSPAHAGCFITRGRQMLTVKLTYDGFKYDIPGGQSTWHESARQTAIRETWEETGYRVRAGPLLARVRNDFHIFWCYLLESQPEKKPDHEISQVNWFGPDKVAQLANANQWRFEPAQAHLYTSWLHYNSLDTGDATTEYQSANISTFAEQVDVTNTIESQVLESSFAFVAARSSLERDDAPAHAGCFIIQGGKMLTVKPTYDGFRYDIPGGQSTWHESARQTAIRETWEETGYRVRAGPLLARVRNDFHIYLCYLLESQPEKKPDHEISQVNWFGPDKVAQLANSNQWRFELAQAHLYTSWLHYNSFNTVDELPQLRQQPASEFAIEVNLINSTSQDQQPDMYTFVQLSADSRDSNAPANAGCFILRGDEMLTVKLTYDGLKYDLPGGTSTGHETARQTAVRETFQETGYKVRAGSLLARVSNGYRIFRCYLLDANPEKLPDHEISEVGWFGLRRVQQLQQAGLWRFQQEANLYTSWLHFLYNENEKYINAELVEVNASMTTSSLGSVNQSVIEVIAPTNSSDVIDSSSVHEPRQLTVIV